MRNEETGDGAADRPALETPSPGADGPDTPSDPPDADEAEVASVAMGDPTDHDPDETGELHFSSDPVDAAGTAEPGDAPFDDWLGDPTVGDGDEAGTPYAELGEEDAADEIADWMSFTQGETDEEESAGVAGEADPDLPEPSEIPVVTDPADDDDRDDTDEFFLDPAGAADGGEESSVDALDVDETNEVEPIGTVHRLTPDPTAAGDDEGQGIPGELEGESETGAGAFADSVFDIDEVDDLTEGHVLSGATSDHADLAAAVARAAEGDTEQVAVAAAIPGIESGIVGFEDVVAVETPEGDVPPRRGSDMWMRVVSAAVLIVAFAAALLWRPALIALALVVFVLAAGEFYSALVQRHLAPLSLFGFLGIVGIGIGTSLWGVIAIPMALSGALILSLLFFAVVPRRDNPMMSLATTFLVAAWVGGLGGFAFAIIQSDDYQVLVVAAVAAVALMDIGQYFIGRSLGRRRLAPVVSPNKTVEGLIGGVVVVLLVGVALSYFSPFDLTSGLAFGAVVAVFAPLGDLAVSAVKRNLDLKDMGSLVPGHGGFLDRIDGLLFVIPAAWAAFVWMGLL